METFCIVFYESYLSMGPAQFEPLEIHHVQCASNHTHKIAGIFNYFGLRLAYSSNYFNKLGSVPSCYITEGLFWKQPWGLGTESEPRRNQVGTECGIESHTSILEAAGRDFSTTTI